MHLCLYMQWVYQQGNNFEDGEIRNAFLSQMMENKCFKDSDRELLSKYLDACVLSEIGRKQEARSIYKYKPVTLKTKPVIGELPGEFRTWREMIGVPLAEMPKIVGQTTRIWTNRKVYSGAKEEDR